MPRTLSFRACKTSEWRGCLINLASVYEFSLVQSESLDSVISDSCMSRNSPWIQFCCDTPVQLDRWSFRLPSLEKSLEAHHGQEIRGQIGMVSAFHQ